MELLLDGNKIIYRQKSKIAWDTKEIQTEAFIQKGTPLAKNIENESGDKVLKFISEQVDLTRDRTILFSAKARSIYENIDFDSIRTIINLQPVNLHQNLNKYFQSINKLLPDAGIYIGCVETYWDRKDKFWHRYHRSFVMAIYAIDFIVNRILPRIFLTNYIYSFFTGGKLRAISLAETLGRLCFCGFDVIGFQRINRYHYFSVIKTKEAIDAKKVSCGLIFKMERIGKSGKIIQVYKLRTMHPYSEYLQNYILQLNGYNKVGKPANDFRLASWGRFMRRVWIDELPQLFNVIKGDMNLVGVRPLSRISFNLLPEDLKVARIKYKPGCIPPNTSLCMKGLNGVMNAERIYLNEMQKHPLYTNFKYFRMAVFNILSGRVSSA